jgi:hypothetical protein
MEGSAPQHLQWKIFKSTDEMSAGNCHFVAENLIAFCFDPYSDVSSTIVTELHPNGDLEAVLEKQRRGGGALDAISKSKILVGISTAMANLPMRGILPRDLTQSDKH